MNRTFLNMTIEHRSDGTWHLKQDAGWNEDIREHWIILEPEQIGILAKAAGYVSADDQGRAAERAQDKLCLLLTLIDAHYPNSPLQRAARVLLDAEQSAEESAQVATPPHTNAPQPTKTQQDGTLF